MVARGQIGVGQNIETDKEHDEVCVGEGFSWPR